MMDDKVKLQGFLMTDNLLTLMKLSKAAYLGCEEVVYDG